MKVEMLEYVDFYGFDIDHNNEVRPICNVFEIDNKVVRILVGKRGKDYPEDYHMVQAVWGFDINNIRYEGVLIETIDPAVIIGSDFSRMGNKEKNELIIATRNILKEHGF